MKTKICTRCGKRLNIDKFHINRASKDGLHCHCKDCRREYVQTNGYKKYREYQTAYQNKYYHEHKNEKRYKQKRKQYAKDFLKKHPGYYKKYYKLEK